jgi:hypothetical protein
MKKTCYLQALFLLLALSAKAQGLFDEKFKSCIQDSSCIYCGDTMAHYTKDLTDYVAWNVNHSYNNTRYELKNFDVMYEVFVDSAGRTCVVSDKSLGVGWSWLMKDDVRKWLTNMPDWKPAVKNGKPINSSVIIEAVFRNNSVGVKYIASPATKAKKQ